MKINKKHKHELKRKVRRKACKRGDTRQFTSKLKLAINPSVFKAIDPAVMSAAEVLEKMRAARGGE